MANELTDVGEALALDFLNGRAPADPVLPLRLRLMSAQGTDSTPGTEVTGGSYTAQEIVMGAAGASGASCTNTITYNGMPATSVVGFEIWDSSATPRRLWRIPRTGGAVSFAAGDQAVIEPGTIANSLD